MGHVYISSSFIGQWVSQAVAVSKINQALFILHLLYKTRAIQSALEWLNRKEAKTKNMVIH